MGFGWTPITQGVTKIIDDHIDEIQTNINTVYTDYGLAPYGWVELPVNAGDFITSAQFQEIRDALDNAHDSRCATDYGVVDDSDDVSILNDQNTGVDTGQYSGRLSGQYTSRLSGQVTGRDSSHYPGRDGTYNLSYAP